MRKRTCPPKVAAATEGGWQHHELFQDAVNSEIQIKLL
jgi:hypothetical protein